MLLQMGAAVIFAQQKPLLIDFVKDKKEKSGYTIQLKTARGNTISFDLLKAGRPVFNQPMNPVTMLPMGFVTKNDALKVAEYMIDQYGKQGKFPQILPPNVSAILNLQNLNHHIKTNI